MPAEYEYLSPDDKPALLALCNEEWQASIEAIVKQAGYKTHAVNTPEDFTARFGAVQYQLTVIDELFSAESLAENKTLQALQVMPMNNRRHSTIILIGDSFQTGHPMQAYQQSVHAVVNRADAGNLAGLIQKTVGDNEMFLHMFRDTQRRIAEGKA